MAEGPTPGGSGFLFGGRGAQQASDSLARTLARLDSAVSRAAPVFDSIAKMGTSFRSGASWNRTSNWVGNNGGGATFNGQPAGSHRAEGPVQTGGILGQGGGGDHRGTGNGRVIAAGAAGTAYSVGSQMNQRIGQTPSDAATDSRLYMFANQQFRYGGQPLMPYKDIYTQGRQDASLSGADLSQASMLISRAGGGQQGSTAWNTRMNSAAAGSLANPTVSLAQSAATQQSMWTPTGWNQMRRVGINTMSGGKQQSITQIAQKILSQVGLSTKRLTPEEMDFVLWDPMSATNQTMSNWVSNGVITPDQVSAIKDQMQMILTARSKGVDSERLNSLVTASQQGGKTGSDAMKALNKLGIADTTMQGEKNVAGSQRDAAVQRLGGFEDGLNKSTEALTQFHDLLNSMTGNMGPLNSLTGEKRGLFGGGPLGGTIALGKSIFGGVAGLFGGGGGGLGGPVTADDNGSSGTSPISGGMGGYSEASAVSTALSAGMSSLGTATSPSGSTTAGATGGGVGGSSSAPGPTPGSNATSNMYGGVKPWVARAGQEIQKKFDVKNVGGVGSRSYKSDHSKGLALDFMVYDDKKKGDQIAAYAVANRKRLGITYIIWYKRIFHTYGSWGPYTGTPDGNHSPTALHMDHVHCSFETKDPQGGGGGTKSGGTGTVTYDAGKGTEQWRGTVKTALSKAGLAVSKANVDRTLMQMGTESSGNPNAINKWDSNWKAGHPSVGLMQVIEGTFNANAGPYKDTGPKAYGVSMDPMANIYSSLKYAVSRYGSLANAYQGHGYAKGAWEIKQDENTRVHKGEMIVPAHEADQIRDVLMKNNPYGGRRGGGVTIEFKPGSIVVHAGAGSKGTGHALGKDIADAIVQDKRIRALQEGVYAHG